MKTKHLKNDILLIIAVLLLAGLLQAVLSAAKTAGDVAVVSVDGVIVAELPLNEDRELRLTPQEGTANTIIVQNGCVCVREADCPDQICVRQGKIQYAGESIVCLPHKLVVTIQGKSGDGPDAYAG